MKAISLTQLLTSLSACSLAGLIVAGCGQGYSDTSDPKMASGNKRTHLGAPQGSGQQSASGPTGLQ